MGFSLLSQAYSNKSIARLRLVRVPSRAQVTSAREMDLFRISDFEFFLPTVLKRHVRPVSGRR